MPRPYRHDPATTNASSRGTLLSKSLSRLLRHAAVQERVPIDSLGYVRLDQLLAWRGLGKFRPKIEAEEIVEAVRESEKMRFGLRYEGEGRVEEEGDAESESVTQRALRVWDDGLDTEPGRFSIRANQGHSMVGVSSEGLLKPIDLGGKDGENIPETVVHGTFYGAWEAIATEGTLRCMGRNHVHFSTGPSVEVARGGEPGQAQDAEQRGDAEAQTKRVEKGRLGKLMAEAGVVSGMRKDAEVLIYVDVKKALAKGMKWWWSENGVVLTDGVLPATPLQSVEDGDAKEKQREDAKQGEPAGEGVPAEFWTEVIEVKEGLGTLWRDGNVVQDLPDRLKGKPLPMGKGSRGGRGGGRGGKEGGGKRGGGHGVGSGKGRGGDREKRSGRRDGALKGEGEVDGGA